MDCVAFDRWLDDGMLEGERALAESHAAECERCALELRAALAIDELLVTVSTPAPEHFSDRVMARVRAGTATPIIRSPFAWWVEAASEPATALATMIAGLVLWQGRALLESAAVLASKTVAALEGLDHLPAPPALDFAHPRVGVAVMLVLGLAATWGSWALYQWIERAFAISASRPRR